MQTFIDEKTKMIYEYEDNVVAEVIDGKLVLHYVLNGEKFDLKHSDCLKPYVKPVSENKKVEVKFLECEGNSFKFDKHDVSYNISRVMLAEKLSKNAVKLTDRFGKEVEVTLQSAMSIVELLTNTIDNNEGL